MNRRSNQILVAGLPGAASDTADHAGATTHPQSAKVTGVTAQDESRPDSARLTLAQLATLARQDLDRAISDGAITLPEGAKVIVHTEYTAVLRQGKHRGVTSLVFTLRGVEDNWAYQQKNGLVPPDDDDRHPSIEAIDLGIELVELGVARHAPTATFRHVARLGSGPRLTAT